MVLSVVLLFFYYFHLLIINSQRELDWKVFVPWFGSNWGLNALVAMHTDKVNLPGSVSFVLEFLYVTIIYLRIFFYLISLAYHSIPCLQELETDYLLHSLHGHYITLPYR